MAGPKNTSAPSGAGLTGVLGGVTTLGQLVQLLKPYFLPASLTQPPFAGTSTGHKAVIPVFQQVIKPMAAGKCSWVFPNPWNYPPVVVYGVVGAPTSGTPSIYMTVEPTLTQVSFQSTLATDTRTLHIIACGNPN